MDRLKRVLTQPDTVLFVGSGISTWSGLPSWAHLIEELAVFVEEAGETAALIRSEASRGDLLQAASYGFDKLTKAQIGEFIRSACRYGRAQPHEIHRKIVSLGPRCFVTTNYDNLLEESLRLWQPSRFYPPPVTNRHLTGTADIVHARAIDFVFKPHGDAGDSDSIVLTHEQYQQLLPDGERHATLESLKMLLATRPIVYLGFGLRDPDFLHVRNLLSNTYKGGTRDHYAIMADLRGDEVQYWRRNYGIHLIGYQTVGRPDKTRDHSPLLGLLDEMCKPVVSPDTLVTNPQSSDTILALARHAGRLIRAEKTDSEFPIRVHLRSETRDRVCRKRDMYDDWRVDRFLDEGPSRALLLGPPGAGKSYALRQAARRLGEKLNDLCLSDSFEPKDVVVPILADFKLYRGNVRGLLEKSLPVGLALETLDKYFRVRALLDSFNEMPREFWETASYEKDLADFATRFPNVSVVIGSRTDDGLTKLRFPVYILDQIEDGFIGAELARLNLGTRTRFRREIHNILQKPFYFHLLTTGLADISAAAHPQMFYQTYFGNLSQAFRQRFESSCNLERALSSAAYRAIETGEEAQPLKDFLAAIEEGLDVAQSPHLAEEITNWLVSRNVVVPYSGARIAFLHQSVTEYLAASQLARLYLADPLILKSKLALKRWDQALFLSLSSLPEREASSFLDGIAEMDFGLAVRAAKYLEIGQEVVVSRLLEGMLERGDEDQASWLLRELPVYPEHEPLLRKLMRRGGSLAGRAAVKLAELKGSEVKSELLRALLDNRNDYNYVANGVYEALVALVTLEDIRILAQMTDSIEPELARDPNDTNIASGFVSATAALLARFDLSSVRSEFLGQMSEKVPIARARIVCDMLRGVHNTFALEWAAELLLRGVDEAATTISFIARRADTEQTLSWTVFSEKHIARLISLCQAARPDTFAVDALRNVCSARPDLAARLRVRALKCSNVLRAVLLHCSAPQETSVVFEALKDLVAMQSEQRSHEPVRLLHSVELDWQGQELLLMRLLKLRDTRLALGLIERAAMYPDTPFAELDLTEISWVLEWLRDQEDPERAFWLRDRLGRILGRYLTPESHKLFVSEFNKPNSEFRNVLGQYVLVHFTDLTTDDFTEDSVSYLLADLARRRLLPWGDDLLGVAATEAFVTERLLPLVGDANSPLSENLGKVLKQAGDRHGRRYVRS